MYMVRGSELNDFLRCRLRWRWAWLDGLRSKKPNNKLFFGTLFHKFLEVWYQTGNVDSATKAVSVLLDEAYPTDMVDEDYNDLMNLLHQIPFRYIEQYKDDLNNWETIATELTFAIPLDDEIGYTGTIDLIVRDKRDGKIYFLDHKTTSSIDKYDKNSDMDRQISRYWWALQQLQQNKGLVVVGDTWEDVESTYFYDKICNAEIGGFIYNIILRDYPVPPKVLKNGSLSKDKSQKTTYELYVDAIHDQYGGDNGAIPAPIWSELMDEYNEILAHLEESPKEFFRRIQVIRNQAEIDSAMTELYATVQDMAPAEYTLYKGHRPLPRIYRNITHECHWQCQFFDLCKATLDGSNADFLIDSIYTREETGNER